MAALNIQLRAVVRCGGQNCNALGEILLNAEDFYVDLNRHRLELELYDERLPHGWRAFKYTNVCPSCAERGDPHG